MIQRLLGAMLLAGWTVAVAAQDAALAEFERQQLRRAEQAELQGRWAEAARAWEVLLLLRPGHAPYRDGQQRLRSATEQMVAQLLVRAADERRRGDLDRASRGYLQLLSLQPDHAGAAEALRQIERERNERQWQGRFARSPIQRGPSEAPPATGERNLAEHASLLAAQGELEGAIALLARPAQAAGADPALRRLLADLLWRRLASGGGGERGGDEAASLRDILRLDPQHEAARARLRAAGQPR
jgi:hypothetical protein